MKRIINILLIFLFGGMSYTRACDVCQRNQPAGFEKITHGAGPSGMIDYIIIWTSVIIVVATLYMAFKLLIKPNEKNPDHIKNIVRNEGF
ncbi:MAG TPA: hypothetical protein VFF21_03500 [Flavobacteriaceae bacterium]|nr:hypothetical protein [Flavobacteriaceae bacterium]